MHFLDFFGKSTVRFFSPPESQAQTGAVECWEELRRQLRIQWSNVVWVRIYGRFMVYLWMFNAYGFSWYLCMFDACGFWRYIYGCFMYFFKWCSIWSVRDVIWRHHEKPCRDPVISSAFLQHWLQQKPGVEMTEAKSGSQHLKLSSGKEWFSH